MRALSGLVLINFIWGYMNLFIDADYANNKRNLDRQIDDSVMIKNADHSWRWLSRRSVKWPSILTNSLKQPTFALNNESNVSKHIRRKRCSCGCAGCDKRPLRACCQPDCCSTTPLPRLCCPSPEEPKSCHPTTFAACCAANPDFCGKTRFRNKSKFSRDGQDSIKRLLHPIIRAPCCPPSIPILSKSPALPPPLPPLPPARCCPPPKPRKPLHGGMNSCGRPNCYNRPIICCPQQSPCWPHHTKHPSPRTLSRCVSRSSAKRCCNFVTPCLRACPACPCRRRSPLGKRINGSNMHCQPCYAEGDTVGRSVSEIDELLNQHFNLPVTAENSGVFTAEPHFLLGRTHMMRPTHESQSPGSLSQRRRKRGYDHMFRSKRQAYDQDGMINLLNVFASHLKATNPLESFSIRNRVPRGGRGGIACIDYPECLLARKRRRKRLAKRQKDYHEAVRKYEVEQVRQKRQFFAPDEFTNCVPCPRWVTDIMLSRKKRDNEDESEGHRRESKSTKPSNLFTESSNRKTRSMSGSSTRCEPCDVKASARHRSNRMKIFPIRSQTYHC